MSEPVAVVGDGAIHVVGAGPAGLAAAITAAKAGARVVVHEREERVGTRFHGDFQGLENWTTQADVLAELGVLGLEPGCELTPFFEQTCFDPDGKEYVVRSQRPLFYLLRRGPGPGTLDAGLLGQARSAGVELRFSDPVDHLPEGGIIATGPRAADAIAVGYLFGTDRADGAFVVFDNRLARGGYAYLLIHNGRATLATCLFSDFHNERTYLERLGNRGYRWLFSRAVRATSAGEWLRRQYSASWAKTAVLPVAQHAAHGRRRHDECADPTCDCTWCRCQHGNTRKEAE